MRTYNVLLRQWLQVPRLVDGIVELMESQTVSIADLRAGVVEGRAINYRGRWSKGDETDSA